MTPSEVIELAASLQAQAKLREAEQTLRDGISSFPQEAPLYGALGNLLAASAREDEALDFIEPSISCDAGLQLLKTLAHYYGAKSLIAERITRPDPAAHTNLKRLRKLADLHELELAPWPGVRISAILITKDEATNIEECIRSVRPIADEVVVVDTGSSDATKEIASALGAKVFTTEWTDDFSAARNESIKHATSDWLLWIDADERLRPDCIGNLLAAVARPHFGGYTVSILNYLHDSDTSQDQVVHQACRLFRNLPGIRFEGRVHEQVTPSITGLGLPIASLDSIAIEHFGYRACEMEQKGKHERNIELLREELRHNPDDAFHWFNLGNSLTLAGEHEEAIRCLSKATEKLTPNSSHGQLAYQLRAFAHIHLEQNLDALQVCEAAEQNGFGGVLITYAKAFANKELGNLRDALSLAKSCHTQTLGENQAGDRTISTYKAKFLEAQILSELEDRQSAEAAFREVLEVVPSFGHARISLALELRAQNRLQDAIDVITSFTPTSDVAEAAAEVAALSARELGKPEEALTIRENAWRQSPKSFSAWQKWVLEAEELERWDVAAKAYSEFAENFEPNAGVLINAGRALCHIGRADVALCCFEDAAKLDPTCANAYLNAGDLLYRTGNYEDATVAYRAGLALDIGNPQAWFVLGNSLFKLGAEEAACMAYEQALVLDPNHEPASANLHLVRGDLHEKAS